MARFKVGVGGEQLDRARMALDRAGIPTIGPPYYGRGESTESRGESTESTRGLLALLDAETAEEAEARVRDNLPGGYTVESAESWEAD
jgi:hypothetical protein